MTDRNLHFLYDKIDRAVGSVINFDNAFKEDSTSIADAYVVEKVTPPGFSSSPPALTPVYDKFMKVRFKVEHACTGAAATLELLGISGGPKSIKNKDGNDPLPSDMPLNSIVDLIYDGGIPGNFVIERTLLSPCEIIYSVDDLPTPDSGEHILEAKEYLFMPGVEITDSLNVDAGPTLRGFYGQVCINKTTAGAMFTATTLGGGDSYYLNLFDLVVTSVDGAQDAIGNIFDIDGTSDGYIIARDFDVWDCKEVGIIKSVGVYMDVGALIGYENDGITFEDCGEVVFLMFWLFGANIGGETPVGATFKGSIATIDIRSNSSFPDDIPANEYSFNFDPNGTFDRITINGNTFLPLSRFFAPDSLDWTSPQVYAYNNTEMPDSTVKALLSISGNASATTTITSTGDPEPIVALWQDGDIEERMVFQDAFSVNASADTIDTLFEHGLSVDDPVTFFVFSGGTLPGGLSAEGKQYYVQSVPTTLTFTLKETLTGGIVDITTATGSGNFFYRHTTGDSSTGWAVYTGLEGVSVRIGGWVSAKRVAGETDLINFSAYIMKTGKLSPTPIEHTSGGVSRISDTVTTSSVLETIMKLSEDEGVLIYIQSLTGSPDLNLIASDAIITIAKS